MNTIHSLSIGLTIMINMISAQTTVWQEQMDTAPTSWTGATPVVLTSDSNCPDPNSYCWNLNSPSSMTRTASTEPFISLRLTYSIAATSLQGSDECVIQYSLDSSVFSDINRISSDTPSSGITDTFSGWGSAADELPTFSIRLVFEGNGHNCYFNEFILEGTPTPNPTKTPTPQPTQSPTIPTLSPTKAPTYPDVDLTACEESGDWPGQRKCYRMFIDPFPGQNRSREISIQDDYSTIRASYYHVYITPRDYDCIDPSISFMYERIDYDNYYNDGEFLDVVNPSGVTLQTCGNIPNACYVFETCFTDFNLGLTNVRKDEETFLLTVKRRAGVNEGGYCSHGLTVNVGLTVTCSDGSLQPTVDPTNLPTTDPTRPSANPTSLTAQPTTTPTFSTLDPTTAPTIATLTPTIHPSSSNGYIGGQLCYGDVAKCWNINIEPIADELTSAQVNIQGLFAAEDTYYVVTFHIVGGVSCEDASVSFRYERIDNDETDEILTVQASVGLTGVTVMTETCGGILSNSCGNYDLCLDDYSLGMDIAAGETIIVYVHCPKMVETLCATEHPWVINAVLTLWCGDASHPPTVITTSPSTEAPTIDIASTSSTDASTTDTSTSVNTEDPSLHEGPTVSPTITITSTSPTITITSTSPTDASTTVIADHPSLIDSQLPTLQPFDDVKHASTDSGQANSHSTIFRTSHTIYASDDYRNATYIFSTVIIVLVIALVVAVYINHKNKQRITITEMVAAVSMASTSVVDDGALSSDPSHQNAGHLYVVEANGIVPGLSDPDREESSSDASHPNDNFDREGIQIQPTGTETNTGTLQKEVVVTEGGFPEQHAEGVHTINIADC